MLFAALLCFANTTAFSATNETAGGFNIGRTIAHSCLKTGAFATSALGGAKLIGCLSMATNPGLGILLGAGCAAGGYSLFNQIMTPKQAEDSGPSRIKSIKSNLCAFATGARNKARTITNATRRALTSKPAKIIYGVTAVGLVAYVARVMYMVGDPEMSYNHPTRFKFIYDENLDIVGAEGTDTEECLSLYPKTMFNFYLDQVKEVIAADRSAAAQAFNNLSGEMQNKIVAFALKANDYIQPAFETISANAASAFETSTGTLEASWNTASTALGSAWNATSTGLGSAWNATSTGLGSAWNATSTGLGSAWDSVRNLTSGLALRGDHDAGYQTASATPLPATRGSILQSCLDSVKSQVPGLTTRQCVVDYDATTEGLHLTDRGINSTVDCLETYRNKRHLCGVKG